MATTYESVFQFVRAIVGDDDPENLLYTSEVLVPHVEMYMAWNDDPNIQPAGDEENFAGDLTGKQKVTVALEIARGLVAPQASYFSYKNPVLSVTRSSPNNQLLAHIRRLQDKLSGSGFLHMKEDNEIWAYLNRLTRWSADLTDDPGE